MLERLEGLVVIDEIEHLPGLFPLLRVLVDRPEADHRYLVLGSASPDLLRQGSESLAGRIAFHVLEGFTILREHLALVAPPFALTSNPLPG